MTTQFYQDGLFQKGAIRLPPPPLRSKVNGNAHLVHLLTDPDDYRCVLLGAIGFSNKAIMRATGLTNCQIYYRLHKAKVRRAEFRNGDSSLAKIVIENASAPAGRVLKQKLLEDKTIEV